MSALEDETDRELEQSTSVTLWFPPSSSRWVESGSVREAELVGSNKCYCINVLNV